MNSLSTVIAPVLNVLKGRKGIVTTVALGVAYYILIGRLPEGTTAEVISTQTDKFITVLQWLVGIFAGTTALEDFATKFKSTTIGSVTTTSVGNDPEGTTVTKVEPFVAAK